MPFRLSLRLLSCVVLLVLCSLFLSLNNTSDFLEYVHGYNEPNIAQDANENLAVIDKTKNCDRCLVSPEWCSEFGSRNMDLSVAYEGSHEPFEWVLKT
jgi:hypothetical protein